MSEIYLRAAAVGLSAEAQVLLQQGLRREGPRYIDWQWVDADVADVVFFDARFLEDVQWVSGKGQSLCAVLLDEDPALAWQIVSQHESALPLSLNDGFKTACLRLLRQHTQLLLQEAVGRNLSGARDQLSAGATAFHLYDMRKRHTNSEVPVAVVDMGRYMVMFSDRADVEAVLHAEWVAKPSADSRLTLGYTAASLGTCMWQYASRSPDSFLPERYRFKTIFARRTHGLYSRLLGSDHLEVLELVRDEPRTFDQLLRDTRWPDGRASKALEGLYLAGIVSTQPRNAVRATQPPSSVHWKPSVFSGPLTPSSYRGS